MLQHASIDTFVAHYSVGIHVDAQAIVRGLAPEKELMRFACSMSRSIDPRRPWKITPEMSRSVNDLPRVQQLSQRLQRYKRQRDQYHARFLKKCKGACREVPYKGQ